MTNNFWFVMIYILSVFLSSVSQILLKSSANRTHATRVGEYLNYRVILGYGLFVVCTGLTIVAFMGVPLKAGPVFESLGYIFVMILAHVFLHEKITKVKLFGNIIIMLGVLIFCYQ